MIHRKDISFPITGDSLIAASRLENGREMTEAEKEFLHEVAKTANEAYEAACHGDTDTVQSIFAAINAAAAEVPDTEYPAAYIHAWVMQACLKGAAVLESSANGNFYS